MNNERTILETNLFFLHCKNSIIAYFKRNGAILGCLLIMCVIVSCISESFLTTSNLFNILRQISTNCFLAFGMTFAILIAGIDLSVGSLLAFSGTFCAYAMGTLGWPIPLAIVVSLLIGTLVGVFNGVIVTSTNIAPFIVTLSTQTAFRGIALLVGNGQPIHIKNNTFTSIGSGFVGPIAYPTIYVAVFMLICYLILNKTKLGRHVYAVGGNRIAAKFAGIHLWLRCQKSLCDPHHFYSFFIPYIQRKIPFFCAYVVKYS